MAAFISPTLGSMEEKRMKAFRPIAVMTGLAMSLTLLGTGSALAQTNEAAEASKPRVADRSGSSRVCRNIVKSGTRLSTRVCRSAADWEKAMLDTQDSALQQQTGPGFRSAPDTPQR